MATSFAFNRHLFPTSLFVSRSQPLHSAGNRLANESRLININIEVSNLN